MIVWWYWWWRWYVEASFAVWETAMQAWRTPTGPELAGFTESQRARLEFARHLVQGGMLSEMLETDDQRPAR